MLAYPIARIVTQHAHQRFVAVPPARVAEPEGGLPPRLFRLRLREHPVERRIGGGIAMECNRRHRAVHHLALVFRVRSRDQRFKQRHALRGIHAGQPVERKSARIDVAIDGEASDLVDLLVLDAEKYEKFRCAFQSHGTHGRRKSRVGSLRLERAALARHIVVRVPAAHLTFAGDLRRGVSDPSRPGLRADQGAERCIERSGDRSIFDARVLQVRLCDQQRSDKQERQAFHLFNSSIM